MTAPKSPDEIVSNLVSSASRVALPMCAAHTERQHTRHTAAATYFGRDTAFIVGTVDPIVHLDDKRIRHWVIYGDLARKRQE